MNLNGIINAAIKEANKSSYRFRMGAVIFNKGNIISTGHNKACSVKRKLNPCFQNFKFSIHCEASAILNARQDLNGFSIMIVRINRKGELRNGFPCEHCQSYLSYVGIRNIHFSTGEKRDGKDMFRLIKLRSQT